MAKVKKGRPVRNKARDMIGDYYKTNREIGKAQDERYAEEKKSGEKQPWTTREKVMIGITIVAVILIVVRFLITGGGE